MQVRKRLDGKRIPKQMLANEGSRATIYAAPADFASFDALFK
jgi:hypothetical protein